MSNEYKIEWQKPDNYEPWDFLQTLPSPISTEMTEIYNYSVEDDGFYFLDNLIELTVAAHAMKLFIDEALKHVDKVTIRKL
jgi:hypothetical protein